MHQKKIWNDSGVLVDSREQKDTLKKEMPLSKRSPPTEEHSCGFVLFVC